MKKILIALSLNIFLLNGFINATENSEKDDSLISVETQEKILKTSAFATGLTLGVWGIWGLRYHKDAMFDGYKIVCDEVTKFTENRPWIRNLAKFSLPIASLTTSYYLIKYAQSKNKKEKKQFSLFTK